LRPAKKRIKSNTSLSYSLAYCKVVIAEGASIRLSQAAICYLTIFKAFLFSKMDNQKPSFYAIIPASVRYNKSLCANAKLLYGEITALASNTGYCYASNRYFAELYEVSRPQTISDWIKQLEAEGYITVELLYSGKEIKQRNIRISDAYTYNEKTLEVQRKNVIPSNEKTLEVQRKNVIPSNEKTLYPTTEKRCDIITPSNTIINTQITTLSKGGGDFQSPLPTQGKDDKKEFSEWLLSKGFVRLASTKFFLEKEKSCAKKEKYGEDGFLAALARIDEYLAKKPKYLADKKDFGRVLDNFAEPKNLQAAKAAFSAFYSTKYGSPYTTYTKADNNALEAILAAIIANVGNDKNIGTDIAFFFAKLGEFAKYQNPLAFKLSFVAADLPAIFAVMRNPALAQARPNGGTMETFRERDKRLIEEEAEEFKRRTFARSQYASQKEIVMRYFERGQAIKPEMLEWQAYKDIIEDRKTAF